jgi:hypothetical protein
MIKLRQIRCRRQLGPRNPTQRMQRRYIIQRLEKLVHNPESKERKSVARAKHGGGHRQRQRLSGRHIGEREEKLGTPPPHSHRDAGSIICTRFSPLQISLLRGTLPELLAHVVKGPCLAPCKHVPSCNTRVRACALEKAAVAESRARAARSAASSRWS